MDTKCHASVVLGINLTTLSHDCNNLQASDALFATNTESVTEKGKTLLRNTLKHG